MYRYRYTHLYMHIEPHPHKYIAYTVAGKPVCIHYMGAQMADKGAYTRCLLTRGSKAHNQSCTPAKIDTGNDVQIVSLLIIVQLWGAPLIPLKPPVQSLPST